MADLTVSASANPGAAEPLAEQGLISLDPLSAQAAACAVGRDLAGYFQFHTALWREQAGDFARALPLNARSLALERRVRAVLGRRGRCLAVHYRQGDFSQFGRSKVFYIAPLPWYVEAVRALRSGPCPLFIYLASDSPVDATPFRAAGFEVLTARDLIDEVAALPGPKPDATVLDFLALKNADALLISNSTFSFTAAMLNQTCRVFLRPDVVAQRLLPFDPWNAEVLLGLEDDPVRFAAC